MIEAVGGRERWMIAILAASIALAFALATPTARAGCIWVYRANPIGLCQDPNGCPLCEYGETLYGYPHQMYHCETGEPGICVPGDTSDHLEWALANIPYGTERCDNAWSAIYIGCRPKEEPTDCREPAGSKFNVLGDPVDVATGVLKQDQTDLDLGQGLQFRRHYASSQTLTSSIGKGWQHSLEWKLSYRLVSASNPRQELVIVHRPLGLNTAFHRTDPIDAWVGGTRGTGGLVGDESDGFLFTDGDGTLVDFDRVSPGVFELTQLRVPGELPILVTKSGDTTTFARADAALALVVHAAPHVNAGQVHTVSGGAQTWTYTYDGADCLRSVSGPSPADPLEVATWTYSYPTQASTGKCTSGRLTKVERAVGSGAPVVLGEWQFSSERVVRIDEATLDQALYLSYTGAGANITSAVVRDTPSTSAPALATYMCNLGTVTAVSGAGGPGVDVPFSAATFTSAADAPGIPGRQWDTVTDENGVKALHEGHDERGRPARIVEGWIDHNLDGAFDAGDGFARLREYTHHPRRDDPLTVVERSAISGAMDRVTTYDYDDPDAAGDTSAPNENPTDRPHREILAGYTIDASGASIAFTDVTAYHYDAQGRLTAVVGPRAAQRTEIDYDAASGSRAEIRRFLDGSGSPHLTWTFSDFDDRGHPETVTDPNGRETLFTYDFVGRVKTATPPFEGPESATLTFTYDIDGNLSRVDFPEDSASSSVFLRMGYDAKGSLTFLADSQGNAIVYSYDKGRSTREARYSGFVDLATPGTLVGDATFSYTAAGNLFRAFNPLFSGGTVYSEFGHDAKGQPTSIRDENARQDVLLYDALGRLETIRQVRSATHETDFGYDALSNVIRVTDAASKATDLLHDDRGHLVETISPDTGTTRFLYDAAGNLVRKIEDAAPGGAARETLYAYDGLDRLLAIDFESDADWAFSYDTSAAANQEGRLAAVSNGVVTTQLEYTQRGDVAVERTTIDGLAYELAYAYDAAGNRTRVESPSGAFAATAYAGLRPGSVEVTASGRTESITDLAWHPFGPRTFAKLPPHDGSTNTVTSSRSVNLRGQITEVDVFRTGATLLDRSYTYDLTTGSPGPADPGPNLDRVVDHRDASQSRFYFYDELDRLAQATTLAGTSLHAYAYDAAGNRTSDLSAAGTTSYAYQSGTNRLDAATGAAARDFAHDAFGNRIYDGPDNPGSPPSLLYDESNRLVQAKDPANGFAMLGNYTYDAFGRRVKKVAGGKTLLFFYDPDGHLVAEVEKRAAAADLARFHVFVEDELMAVVDEAIEVGSAASSLGVRIDLPPPLAVLLLFAGAGLGVFVVTRRAPLGLATTTSGAALLLLCAQTAGNPRFAFVHVDPLGTPLAVTSAPATYAPTVAIWRATHEPFGRATVDEDPDGDSNAFALHVRFPGQYEDVETGWHYNYARTYDPATGRYLEADPIGLAGGWNLYAYAASDPINAIDPLGLSVEDVRSIWRQALQQFQDVNPIGIPVCGLAGAGSAAWTAPWSGNITVPQALCDKKCLSRDEWEGLFFTLFHESMHSSDSTVQRFMDAAADSFNRLTPNHQAIHNRTEFERSRPPAVPNPVWGIPRAQPLTGGDRRTLYEEYRKRTPACQCEPLE